jgi:hypothetical protein
MELATSQHQLVRRRRHLVHWQIKDQESACLHESGRNLRVLVVSKASLHRKNRGTPSNNIALRRHTNRRSKRLRIHRNRLRLSLRHILHRSFPIRSLVNKFLTLDLALSDQLDAVNQALESA